MSSQSENVSEYLNRWNHVQTLLPNQSLRNLHNSIYSNTLRSSHSINLTIDNNERLLESKTKIIDISISRVEAHQQIEKYSNYIKGVERERWG